MSKPDNSGKSDTKAEAKAEAPTTSPPAKPAVARRQGEISTVEKIRNAILTGVTIGFFYTLFHSLHLSLTHSFWWLVSVGAVVFIVAISCRPSK
jgi:hypothetical protein